MRSMTEQESKSVTTAQATPAEPVHPAPIVPPAGVPRVWRALGLVFVGALLALAARNVLPVSQTMFASLQGETKGASDIQPPVPTATDAGTSSVRISKQQTPHITIVTVGMKGFREEK